MMSCSSGHRPLSFQGTGPGSTCRDRFGQYLPADRNFMIMTNTEETVSGGFCGTLVNVSSSFLFRNLKIGYFSQHHVDQLDLNVCAVELLLNKFPGNHGDNNVTSSFTL